MAGLDIFIRVVGYLARKSGYCRRVGGSVFFASRLVGDSWRE
jgi:hypothetical protein